MTTPAKPTPAPKPATPRKPAAPRRPQDRKGPTTKAPVETATDETPVDPEKEREARERREELLEGMPALRPAARFRLRHRNDFTNLVLEAKKSGAFEGNADGELDFDMDKPEDIEQFQKLQDFIVSVDEWAESIADDPAEYDAWSEGKKEETFLALFVEYREALGE